MLLGSVQGDYGYVISGIGFGMFKDREMGLKDLSWVLMDLYLS